MNKESHYGHVLSFACEHCGTVYAQEGGFRYDIHHGLTCAAIGQQCKYVWDQPYAGFHEAALILGQSKQTVGNWVKRKHDFPEPVAHLAMGPIWRTEDLLRWKTQQVLTTPIAGAHGDGFHPNTKLYGRNISVVDANEEGDSSAIPGVLKEILSPHSYLIDHGEPRGIITWGVDSVNDLEVPEDGASDLTLWNAF